MDHLGKTNCSNRIAGDRVVRTCIVYVRVCNWRIRRLKKWGESGEKEIEAERQERLFLLAFFPVDVHIGSL